MNSIIIPLEEGVFLVPYPVSHLGNKVIHWGGQIKIVPNPSPANGRNTYQYGYALALEYGYIYRERRSSTYYLTKLGIAMMKLLQ